MSSGAVARGAQRMLKRWLPPTLASYRLATGLPVATPAHWLRVPPAMLDRIADQVPAITVWGGATTSVQRSGRDWSATFTLTVAAVDRHDDWDSTADFAEAWETVLVTTMLAHPDLDGTAEDLRWQGSDPTMTRDRAHAVVLTTWHAWVDAAGSTPAGRFAAPPVADSTGMGPDVPLLPAGLAAGVDLLVVRDRPSTVEAP